MSELNAEVEEAVRTAVRANQLEVAATRALEAYGKEILSFLVARLRSKSDGEEAFSVFAEDFWKGLPDFAFRCSVRGWMYTVARNAANRYASSPQLRPARNLTMRCGFQVHRAHGPEICLGFLDERSTFVAAKMLADTAPKGRHARPHAERFKAGQCSAQVPDRLLGTAFV
jgi:DNA-directed RNA polymerase specialized sigma24 family protein